MPRARAWYCAASWLALTIVEKVFREGGSQNGWPPFVSEDIARLVSVSHFPAHASSVVRRGADQRGFQVLPKRWIVERTFGWLMKYRRLRCDYEQLTANSEAMIYIAMTRLMLRRLHP